MRVVSPDGAGSGCIESMMNQVPAAVSRDPVPSAPQKTGLAASPAPDPPRVSFRLAAAEESVSGSFALWLSEPRGGTLMLERTDFRFGAWIRIS